VLSKAFDLRCTIPEIENVGEPLLPDMALGGLELGLEELEVCDMFMFGCRY